VCNLRELDWLVSDMTGFGAEKPHVEVGEPDFYTLRAKLLSREFPRYFIDEHEKKSYYFIDLSVFPSVW